MLQRFENIALQEQLNLAKQELIPHFEQLAEISYENLPSPDTAQLIIPMINQLSNPILGIQIIRKNLIEAAFPYLTQYEMIFNKAEFFYIQSLMIDLNRIKNDEPLMQISKEEIRQCVQELNWKINVELTSALNESQEVIQNMDLMKFFQGVRNYQNWQENIKRQCMERLKEKAHSIQIGLTLKKGFITSKMQQIINKIKQSNLSQLFNIAKYKKTYKQINSVFEKIYLQKEKSGFQNIRRISQQNGKRLILLKNMIYRYTQKKFIINIRKTAIEINNQISSLAKFTSTLAIFKRKVQLLLKCASFKQLNVKPMIKAAQITEATQRLTNISKRVIVRQILKNFNIPTKAIFQNLHQGYISRVQFPFKIMKDNNIEIKLQRPNVSDRIKGKVLVSLNKQKKEPIDLKKTFNKWYVNTHEQKFSKQVYNIWMQGTISKFTFFMRLKNLCDQVNKQMFSKEMKSFIKIACQKYHKYQDYNKKTMLTKWIENTRRIRKIQSMLKLLINISNQTQNTFARYSFEKIIVFCKRKQIIKRFLTKYLLNFLQRRKVAVKSWTNINNIKKEWGRKIMRALLNNIAQDITITARQTLNIFKTNRIIGREKKLKQCRRTINIDTVYLSRFFHIWRFNQVNNKVQQSNIIKNISEAKTNALIKMSSTRQMFFNSNLKKIVQKFKQNKNLKERRLNNVSSKFIQVIQYNQNDLRKQVLNVFINYLKQGKAKKEKLVTKLVHANFIKQKLSFSIMRNKSYQMTQLMKRQKCMKIYELLQEKVKENLYIFNKKLYVTNVLQKMLTRRAINVTLALNSWKGIPLRMRWGLRQKAIKVSDTIKKLMIDRFNTCNSSFKSSIAIGKLKQKKGIYIMACKFNLVIKRYFEKYYKNACKLKQDHQIKMVNKIFQNISDQTRTNLNIIMENSPLWSMKQASFEMLNEYVKKRVRSYLLIWHKNSNAISYCIKIVNQKKRRLLQNMNKVILREDAIKIRNVIQIFYKNKKIKSLQLNFLRKLSEGHVGKLLKGLTIWKRLPQVKNRKKIMNITTSSTHLTQIMKKNMSTTIKILQGFRKHGLEIKQQSVIRIVSSKCSEISRYFHKWLHHKRLILLSIKNNAVQKVFNIIMEKQQSLYNSLYGGKQTQRKLKSLQMIASWCSQRNIYSIKHWFKMVNNLKFEDVTKRHVLISLNNTKIKFQKSRIVNSVIQKFKINRLLTLKEKKRIKTDGTLKLLENQAAFKRRQLNQTTDKLKYNHYKGNFIKNQTFHKYLTQRIGQVHKCLIIWDGFAVKVKQTQKQKITTHNFDSLKQTVKQNFKVIFSKGRQQMIKKHILFKIFTAKQIQFKGYFNLWRQNIKQLKILGEINKQAKSTILERINKILRTTSNQNVIDTIKKFHMNFKIQRVQRKIYNNILNTKSGKVIQAFKSWKTIPFNQKMGKFKNYQKFFFHLEGFYKHRLRTVNNAFIDSQEQGNSMKKQSILKVFEMTSLGIRRFYNRWTRLTKQKHTLMQVHYTLKIFQSVEGALDKQYQKVFQYKKPYNIKINAIKKLISATKEKIQTYARQWRENTRLINAEKNKEKQKKAMALRVFNQIMVNSHEGQLLNVIHRFKKNGSIIRISRTFFTRLMLTKTGKVIQFFQKLKTVPDAKINKRKKKGIMFESKLHHLVHKRLRFALTPFKDNSFDANIKKKYCLDRLLRACMGQNKKKFIIWREVVKEAKILKHTTLFEHVFSNLRYLVRDNFLIISKQTHSEIQKKKNLCRKLINNSQFVQHHAYLLWKEAYYIDDINIKNKQTSTQTHLRSLVEIFKQNQNKKVIQAIDIFRRILQTQNILQSGYYKDYKNQKCLAFYDKLKKMEICSKNSFIGALRANKAQFALGDKSQKMLSVFQLILKASQNTMSNVLNNEQQISLRQKAFTILYQNQWNNMRKTLNLWRQGKMAIDNNYLIKQEQKKQALLNLKSLLAQNKKCKILEFVKKFQSNFIVEKAKGRASTKIWTLRSNNCRTLFLNWKNLPYQEAKKMKTKATKFEKSLHHLLLKRLKFAHGIFKGSNIEGITKKQNAVRSIVRCKMIDSNSSFFKWRKVNNQNKIKQKILTLDRAFTIADNLLKENLTIFDGSKIQDQRKVRAITQLFNRNVANLRKYLLTWRTSAKTIKLRLLDKYMCLFNPQFFNKRFLKIAFLMIEKKKDMEAMKGYINSLWKWKMSNIQATYYTKFIKVFKQSQEVVKLSTLITRKVYQRIHYGFRSILTTGSQRTNRKREILTKYLTRRLRNNFTVFKNATSKTEINVWRSKYTQSIKAKILYDILSTLILRCKFAATNSIKGYYQYTNKIDLLESKFVNHRNKQLTQAFSEIKWSGHKKLLTLSSQLFQKVVKIKFKKFFGILNINKKISKLSQLISRTLYKQSLYYGFSFINKRKQRSIKCKLSIILLSTLIQNARREDRKYVIKQFAKNRMKRIGFQKIWRFFAKKYQQYSRPLFDNGTTLVNIKKLLQRYKRGQALKKILDKQDEQLKKNYLNKMRKKQNKWLELAIKKFATRASIRSSPAICLWRLKTYVMNT